MFFCGLWVLADILRLDNSLVHQDFSTIFTEVVEPFLRDPFLEQLAGRTINLPEQYPPLPVPQIKHQR